MRSGDHLDRPLEDMLVQCPSLSAPQSQPEEANTLTYKVHPRTFRDSCGFGLRFSMPLGRKLKSTGDSSVQANSCKKRKVSFSKPALWILSRKVQHRQWKNEEGTY